jgi:hypothetical protein
MRMFATREPRKRPPFQVQRPYVSHQSGANDRIESAPTGTRPDSATPAPFVLRCLAWGLRTTALVANLPHQFAASERQQDGPAR